MVLGRHPRSTELVIIARLSNLLIIITALVAAANVGSIQTAWHISLLFGAGMGLVLILRWLWERINLYSELAAILSSLIIAPLLLYLLPGGEQEWIRLALMAFLSGIFVLAATLLTPPTEQSVLNEFYRRARPPGFWSRTAIALDLNPSEPRRRLWRGLISLSLCALSLFLLLIGIGRLLLPLPESGFFKPWFYILGGIALLPLWIGAVGDRYRR